MGQLDGFTSREVMRVVETFGWRYVRASGSHFIYSHPEQRRRVAIPSHRDVSGGLVRTVLRQTRISPSQFLERAKK